MKQLWAIKKYLILVNLETKEEYDERSITDNQRFMS